MRRVGGAPARSDKDGGRKKEMAYFPMFVDLDKRPCLVVGGGRVAYRKVKVLQDFGARVYVAAPVICAEIYASEPVICTEKEFASADAEGMALVIAATDDAGENHRIADICAEKGIPVNAVDQIEDCSFIFPSYIRQKDVVAAFSSAGNSPVITQYLKRQAAELLTEQIGDLAEYLGNIRQQVKELVPTEGQRKRVYEQLLQIGLETGRLPNEGELYQLINSKTL